MSVPLSLFTGLTGRIIVRLAQELVPRLRERIDADLPDLTDLGQLASTLHLSGLSALLSHPDWQPQLQTYRTFPVPSARIFRLEAEARQRDFFPPLHSLTSYWSVDLRGLAPSDRLAFALALRQTPAVELVYFEPQFSEPTVPVGSNPCIGQQGYLDAAPKGIDARAAWTAGFDGAGVTFIDLEQDWQWEHTDLTGPPLNLSDASVKGLNPRDTKLYTDHGTNVLGVVVAHDNGAFGIGIAPNPGLVELVAWNKGKWDVANAILQATLRDPEVLLLEVQTGPPSDVSSHYPVEVTDACFDAIRLASGTGITVIEAAGNSDHDLDRGDWVSVVDLGIPGLRRNKLERGGDNDSGAVLVAAAKSAAIPHVRWRSVSTSGLGSNYGARIDCYAWGDSVATTGSDHTRGGPNDWRTNFGATSAASAIVAGAAVLMHQMYRKTFLSRLSPPQARQLLSNPAIGTKCQYLIDHTDFPIGVMPDLGKIINAVGAVADVYVRDSLADTGAVPNAALGQSPDIFVVRAGQAAALAGLQPTDDGPPRTVLRGATQEVYVRAFNRGGSPAQPTARVYWTEPATYLDPDDWNDLGTTAAFPVPAGGNALSPPLSWTAAGSAVPAGDHGCFVAILDDPNDAAPLVPATFYNDPTWFQTFLAQNNNVAFRNFSVVDLTIFLAQVALPDFLIRGLRRRVFSYDLELTHDLPSGARLVLRSSDDERAVPPFLTGMGGTREEPLPRHVTWRDLSLGARQEARVQFHLLLSAPLVGGPFTIRIRQLYRGNEAGRYTWLLQTRP